jgi:hypothetical protein
VSFCFVGGTAGIESTSFNPNRYGSYSQIKLVRFL